MRSEHNIPVTHINFIFSSHKYVSYLAENDVHLDLSLSDMHINIV